MDEEIDVSLDSEAAIRKKIISLFSHKGIVNLIKMSKKVHHFPNLFAYACNNKPEALRYISIKNDQMRKEASLGYK